MALVQVLVAAEKDDGSSDDADDDVYDAPRKKQLELVRCNLSQHRQLPIPRLLLQNRYYLESFDVSEETEGNVLEDVGYFRARKLIDTCCRSLSVVT